MSNTTLEKSHTADDLAIKIPVTFDAGALVQTLAGATIVCVMSNEVITVAASSISAVITTPTSDEHILAVWADGTLTKGQWRGQARVTNGGHTQTVAEWVVPVAQSL